MSPLKRIAAITLIVQSVLLLVSMVYASHIVGSNDFDVGYALLAAGAILGIVYIAGSTLLAYSAYKRADLMPPYSKTCIAVVILTNWLPALLLLLRYPGA